jgi:Ca-activated chloride channel homolog
MAAFICVICCWSWLFLPCAKQQLLCLPLLLFLWPQQVPAAEPEAVPAAQPAAGLQWQDLWQSRTEQAKQAYDAGDYATAQAKFKDPLWQGNAAYRAGDYDAAASLYAQEKTAAGQFNLGNSLAMQQQFEQALAAYQNAAQQQPDLPGVQDNIRLMQKLLEQQQEQQQQSGDGEQQNDQQQGSEQKGDSEQQQEQQEQQGQPQSQDQQQNDQAANEQDPAQQEQAQQKQQQSVQQTETAAPNEQPDQQQQAIEQAWPNASPEESQQLENLLRKVQDEPSLLLKNKMLLSIRNVSNKRCRVEFNKNGKNVLSSAVCLSVPAESGSGCNTAKSQR